MRVRALEELVAELERLGLPGDIEKTADLGEMMQKCRDILEELDYR